MLSHPVRLPNPSYLILVNLARSSGKPMSEVLSHAVERYRRERFVTDANKAFAQLHQDRKLSAHERKERALWESTLLDDQGA